ncbi:MAG: PulJ/GspJ family protein [Terrimicrobiaceae bacterium]
MPTLQDTKAADGRERRGFDADCAPSGWPPIVPAGFTLLELLVSMTILILLVAILAGIFSSVSKTSQLGYSNNERMQNILAVTDFIRSDLRSALLPVNRPDTNNLQFVVNPGSISGSFKNPHAVFWQSPAATDQTLGDVAEVGYFVKWNTNDASKPKPYLCRFSVANSAAGTNFLIYSSPATWLTDSILNAVAPADAANAYQGLIAENVVALFVQCLDARGQPITRNAAGGTFTTPLFDSRLGFLDSGATNNTNLACALPPIVRLGFVLADSRSANRIGPTEKTTLTTLGSSATDAPDYVTKALARTDLKGIAEGLRSYQIEVNLFNAR